MGVPSFFRWLINKYPKVVVNAIEERDELVDPTLPNPNGIEFDNLYLDMNGIIHPCFHPDDDGDGYGLPPPRTYEDVFNNIFEYIDRLFKIVRPRKLLYMAIDGVAPRAKMNQQRSRRFKSAMDKNIAEIEEKNLRQIFENKGKAILLEEESESEVSDSNIITPGTDFMFKLSKALRKYIRLRLTNDPGWRDIKVILSDANVPGEGEHKVMSFIRHQRTVPSYDPNTHHCLYGLDADLIMLSLATHEVHFSILREDLLTQNQVQPHAHSQRTIPFLSDKRKGYIMKKPYQFLHIWILREYLELDMKIDDPPENFKFDLERIIDDFIFICFFAGNDFLPHMPTLEIHEGAIDLLMTVYKKEFKKIGGYLVDMIRVNDKKWGYIKLSRVEKFILLVGAYEERIFKKRSEIRNRKLRRLCYDADSVSIEEEIDVGGSNAIGGSAVSADNVSSSEIVENTKEFKQKLKASIRRKSDFFGNGDHIGTDKVRLGATGFKERYYKYKFSAESPGEIESRRKEVVKCYTEGLLWVLLYYFSGPPSWKWFYPYHYGPFASDMKGLAQIKPYFETGSPFKPIDTLMAVLPPRSAHALPKEYQTLMMEEYSSIIDFYPSDFEVDMDGKRFTWQGICKLPFIEESRLLHETRKLEKGLMGEEIDRNTEKLDQLFIRSSHGMVASQIVLLSNGDIESVRMDTNLRFGMSGFLYRLDDNEAKVKGNGEEDCVLCAWYELPNISLHVPRLLDGLQHPMKTISECEIMETVLWHECQGNVPTRSSPQVQGRFRKPNDLGNASFCNNNRFTSTSPANSVHKFAGSGWGCGRGKANVSSNSGDQSYSPKGMSSDQRPANSIHKFAGSGWGRGIGRADGSSNSRDQNYSPKGISSDQRVVWSSSSYYVKDTSSVNRNEGTVRHGFNNLNLSDSSGQGWRPTGRGVQPLNNDFRPSRINTSQDGNFAGHGSQSFHTWGRGRGQRNSWQQTYPFAGEGRGQQDLWTHGGRPSSAANYWSSNAGERGNSRDSHFIKSHKGQQ